MYVRPDSNNILEKRIQINFLVWEKNYILETHFRPKCILLLLPCGMARTKRVTSILIQKAIFIQFSHPS